MTQDEYVIVNKTTILKRIEEWESELQECFKVSFEEFDSIYVSTLQQAIATAKDFLSQSTPLIPVVKDAFKAAKIPFKINYYGTFGYENAEHYIENLKLDI
jgi:hypothetical protein